MTSTTVAPKVTARSPSDYSGLMKIVRKEGLLQRRPGYYARKITVTVSLFAAGWVALFMIGASWWSLIPAIYLAVMSTQVAFTGHDAGHKQIVGGGGQGNHWIGLFLGDFLCGMSIGYWVDKHNKHHSHPNHKDKDPDVGVGALVHTWLQARARSRAGRLLSQCQAFLFFPMLLLEGMNLHVASIRAMLGGTVKSKDGSRALEAFLLLLHIALYLAAVFYVLTPIQGLAFIAVHQGLWGLYMGISFAPNHKGMPILDEDMECFLRRQVLTSRDIKSNWFINWFLGGLNFQIAHHLFPSMSRPCLLRSQKIIRDYLDKIGVPYVETGFFESYAIVLRHLYRVGRNLGSKDGTNA